MILHKQQKGIAHLGAVLAFVLVLGIVGFAGYRVMQNNSQSNSETSNDGTDTADQIKNNEETLEGLEEKELENNKLVEESGGVDPASYGDGETGLTFVNFVKGGGSLVNNESVNVTLVADRELNGDCKWLFYLGNSSVAKTTNSVQTKECHVKVPLAEFPKSGNWYVTVAYDSNDGKETGVGGGFQIEVMPTITTANFTKGGSNLDSGVLSVSATMDKTSSGVCTYTFSLNGSVRVEKTSNVSNGNKCDIKINQSEFPKSATYNMVISFVSNDGFTQGTTSWDVTVK